MSKRMTKSAFLALQLATVLALSAPPAFSQTADSASQKHSLHAGAWAMQFQIGSNFYLGAFDGAMLSILKHTSLRAAWRLGAGVSGDVVSRTTTTQNSQDTLRPRYDTDTDNNSQTLSLVLTRIAYANPQSAINFFCGIGPRFSYTHSYSSTLSPSNDLTRTTSNGWSAGLGGLLGVQWFPGKAIGLSAEYGSSLAFNWDRRKDVGFFGQQRGTRVESVTTNKRLSLAAGGVRMGLSLYW